MRTVKSSKKRAMPNAPRVTEKLFEEYKGAISVFASVKEINDWMGELRGRKLTCERKPRWPREPPER